MLTAERRSIPLVPLGLGLGGLIPFWGLAIAIALRGVAGFGRVELDQALVTYAAVIVSFLGGIRWGLAVAGRGSADEDQSGMYIVSIIPSLLAWALLAAPEPWRSAGLGLLALAMAPLDTQLVRDDYAPFWFGRLRIILSTGAAVALFGAAVAMR